MRLRRALALPLLLAPLACPGPPKIRPDTRAPCRTLDAAACARARALLDATSDYGVTAGPFVVDASAPRVVGRGIARDSRAGTWADVGLACATPVRPASAPSADRARVDHAFVALLLDDAIVPPDEPLAPRLALDDRRPHRVRLAAVALARDLDPQFFEPTAAIDVSRAPCACGRATHVVGAPRLGAMLAYDVDARAIDRDAPLADAVRVALVDPKAAVHEARVGDLVLEGLGRARSLGFTIRALAPVAHAIAPASDLCPHALPAPEVVPAPLDFGEAAYGHPVDRVAHVVNRASIGIRAVLGVDTIVIPARSTADLPLRWTPDGDAPGCETQTRDETIVFLPDGDALATPSQQSSVIHERIRTGRETIASDYLVDTTTRKKADFEKATAHDVACPPDFAVTSCRAERRACTDTSHDCTSDGYEAVASMTGNGCHFACRGPENDPRAACRFEGVTECHLACSPQMPKK